MTLLSDPFDRSPEVLFNGFTVNVEVGFKKERERETYRDGGKRENGF